LIDFYIPFEFGIFVVVITEVNCTVVVLLLKLYWLNVFIGMQMFTPVAVKEIFGFWISSAVNRIVFCLLNEIIVSPFFNWYVLHDAAWVVIWEDNFDVVVVLLLVVVDDIPWAELCSMSFKIKISESYLWN